MANNNPFAYAEGKRIEITNMQAKQIRGLYKDIRHEMQDKIRILSHKTNVSSIMRDRYLKDFAKDLSADIRYLNRQLENTITVNSLKVAEAVVEDSNKLNEAMGFRGVFTNNYYIPHQAVESIITGQLYEGKWTLSKAIWSDNQKKLNDINEIVAKGMIANKSTYDIAKDLERYVNPQARKGWEWSKVYPHTSKKIDYNAQRLARTMVSHAYQESFVRSTKENPFIDSYRWLASGSDRMCEECAERDGKIFSKDELPLDHPNGMCTFEAVISKSYDEIASDIRNWVDNTGDPELNNELNGFANSLGYNVKDWTANYMKGLGDKVDTSFVSFFNAKPESKITSKEEFITKWNIPVKGDLSLDTIKNFDIVLDDFKSSYLVDPKKYIRLIDDKNPGFSKDNQAYYFRPDKGIHIITEANKNNFSIGKCAHEAQHGVNFYLTEQKYGYFKALQNEKVCDDIVSKVFAANGYKINSKTNLPFENDVIRSISTYKPQDANEIISEAKRNMIEYRMLGKKLDYEKYTMSKQICKEVEDRMKKAYKNKK